MTEPLDQVAPLQGERMEAAEADLGELREILSAAGRGEASPSEVRDSFAQYWRQHGPSLRAAAAALGEETRRQVLVELYRWREQLNAQLQAKEPGNPSAGRGPAV